MRECALCDPRLDTSGAHLLGGLDAEDLDRRARRKSRLLQALHHDLFDELAALLLVAVAVVAVVDAVAAAVVVVGHNVFAEGRPAVLVTDEHGRSLVDEADRDTTLVKLEDLTSFQEDQEDTSFQEDRPTPF